MTIGFNFEFKVRKLPKSSLTSKELHALAIARDEKGRHSTRRFQGLREFPKSVVDRNTRITLSEAEFARYFPDVPLD